MHTFLEESDAASLRRPRRRRAQIIAARMSQTSPRREVNKSPDVSSRPMVFRRSVDRVGDSDVLTEGREDCSLSLSGG